MKDLDYFIAQASNSTQREFELDFADVIEVFDTNATELTTEDGKQLIIHWYSNGYYQSYQVIKEPETTLMKSHPGMVEEVISMLRYIQVDGETMQYILEKVGMQDQMLRQLVMSATMDDVFCLVEEKNML
jgi:hypothetical protein